MNVHPSSATYGDQMGKGWKEGLKHKYGNNVEVHLNRKVADTTRNDIGDVDFILHSNHNLCIYNDLFPTSKLNIRPAADTKASARKSNCIVAEIKRSMDSYSKMKIDKFVQFYAGLFGKEYKFTNANGSQVFSSKRLFGSALNEAVANENTLILFVFNGQDLTKVQGEMRNSINTHLHNNDMLIHGHQVICVWCDSTELIDWKLKMESEEKDEALAEKDEALAENYKALAEKDEALAEKDEALAEKDRRIAELEKALKKRLSGNKRKRH